MFGRRAARSRVTMLSGLRLSHRVRTRRRLLASTLTFATGCALALVIVACGGGGRPGVKGGVTVEPVKSATAAPTASITGVASSPTPDGGAAWASERWIDVDVTNFVVRLMDGKTVLREISPVAVGEQIDTGEYASTQTGLFHVYDKVAELAFDPPYNAYISHWVGFDADKANGFHSFLKDEDGHVVDASTGRVSNGCIRTGAPEEVFAFAEIGMPVYLHW
jgi:hypothetical protein